jgi:putative RNA 2'-phosphotransferase
MDERSRVRISKRMSLVLRHRPELVGLTLDEGGWVAIDVLLAALQAHGLAVTRAELDEVVRTNDKQRYAISADGTRIRANQGHSIDVDLGLEPLIPPDILYHGTSTTALPSIRRQGLLKGRRQHVHLSADPETAEKVGTRHGTPAVLVVRAGAMHRDGHPFYRSANGVWLTATVPPGYLEFPA